MTRDELFSIRITEPDQEIQKKSKKEWDSIAKPIDGLGSFEDIVSRIAAVQGKVIPEISRKALIIMCADNGVVEEGVSQTSQDVTRAVAELMGQKRSSVGIMTQGYPMDFFVYDIGINSEDTPSGVINAKVRKGTGNFTREAAMEESECLAAIQTGIDAVKKCRDAGYNILATGEMGIGNTTTSTALLCALMGVNPKEFTGKGAGLTDDGLINKIQVIEKGIRLHLESRDGGQDWIGHDINSKEEVIMTLSCLGGLDIAGLAGVFIGGAIYHIPIVIDGLISAVAALIAEKLVPGCRQYMFASHMGREKGMDIILKELSLKPIIHADLALGEGTGAILLFPMLDMAMSLYKSGTSFGDTEIEQYERLG
ncbi:MAG: nicotinate-nucleotide--dimethylbenzimidazole phosphoribosyltransferase [Eubacterium sp.]|nr:nicotinate-nucleotide--dimethylbenzimidazole phosphoribosyltransferase [Eubacterium sp.]